jgi:uncharacterized protein (TIGR02246 family)
MIKEIPKDEMSAVIREWYYSASEGQAEKFLSFFAQDPRTVYFGTDPEEQWYGYDQIKSFFTDLFRTYGKWAIMSKNLNVEQFGEIALFSDEVEISATHGASSIAQDGRMTGALMKQNGQWKIVQAHFSFGTPSSELLPG